MAKIAASISGGLIVGICVALLAVLMAGGGHGWTSAFASCWSIVGAPLSMLAWFFRERRRSFFLALGVVVGAIFLDIWICRATLLEGTEYVGKVWNAEAGFLVLWTLLFVSWQLLAGAVVVLGCVGAGGALPLRTDV